MRVLQDLRTRLAHSLSSMREHLRLGSDVVELSIPYSLVNKQRIPSPFICECAILLINQVSKPSVMENKTKSYKLFSGVLRGFISNRSSASETSFSSASNTWGYKIEGSGARPIN